MERCHLYGDGGPLANLVDRARKAAADESRPSGRAETPGGQLAEDIVDELAAFRRSRDCVAMGEPPAGLTGHAGTIAADGSPSVMGITFSARVSRMMGFVARASSADRYDLVVIGGGSAGLTAADFAARIGAKVLIASEQVGGDCTWTDCIPSKALIRAARLARDQRNAGSIGIGTGEVRIDFPRVMAEVRGVIARVYSYETPEVLAGRGIEVAIGPVRFLSGDATSNPTAAWVWRQLMEATPWGHQPSHLIHDGDAVYGRDFDERTRAVGVIGVQTPRRAPNANSIAERVVRSIRVECLDHLIVINDRHLIAALTDLRSTAATAARRPSSSAWPALVHRRGLPLPWHRQAVLLPRRRRARPGGRRPASRAARPRLRSSILPARPGDRRDPAGGHRH